MDLSGLLLAYIALRIASRPATPQATYGYYRAEVLAAAFNGFLLLGIASFIGVRAVERLRHPLETLDYRTVLIVAAIGLLANLVPAWILRHDAKESINTRGAWLNVMGDALASVGVIASALLVAWTGNVVWDTLVSFLVAAIIVWGGTVLIRSTLRILLEAAPPHLDLEEIKDAVDRVDGVVEVHDLHVWTLTPGRYSASLHAYIQRRRTNDYYEVIAAIEDVLAHRFGLEHCTIQVEPHGIDPGGVDRDHPLHGPGEDWVSGP